MSCLSSPDCFIWPLEASMSEPTMTRTRTPEEVKRLKEMGLFDVGDFVLARRGFNPPPKRKLWDREGETGL